ncbi:PREDICTED: uncharacterized protein LOC106744956 [Dinoponera quadriceps]|uniref:Uncharacterized protein LOC106744956 n=1 Tax=Dinoponera quadriceps TaxID=609295 RepID=A0A6P3XB35_DINQU|nr:PREDICTED: uncharacterized protein LOC106744956 [Dinoponera quadriceps]
MTSMPSPCITSCLLLLLLAVVHSASEVERPRQGRVGGHSGREGILPAAAAPDLTTLRTTANATMDNSDDIARIGIPELTEKDGNDKVDPSEVDESVEKEEAEGKENEKEEQEVNEKKREEEEGAEGEEEEEGEYDDEDEYEDELKAIAESHEAMSKDEAKNSNASSAGSERAEGKLSSVKNFDSHEKSNEDMSDEDIASNEAIGGDVIEEEAQDEEVAELLKYKMGKGARTKAKRMPTVKKELSTQREILLASNETQVPKSLLPSEDPFNRLNGKTDYVERRSLERNEVQEVALADSLLKFLVKLAEDPNRWQRVHKFLTNMENDLQASENIQDPVKRGYDTTSSLFSTTPASTNAPKKSRKKPKKKKKRPRHRQVSTTVPAKTTTSPETSTPITTTEAWSTTTTPQWRRLVAERLFGPPWQQEEAKNLPKVHYGLASKPRTSVLELVNLDKPRNILRTMNTERIPLLDFPRESNTQSQSLRFGKINTYQPLRLQDSREFAPLYDRPADSDRPADYYLSEAVYPPVRYTPTREFLRRRNENDYQDDLTLQTDNFAYNQEYRPSSREFASSKGWPELAYKPGRAWNSDERPLFTMSSGKWPWGQQSDFKYWPERGKYSERNYWGALGSEEDGDRMNQAELEEWQQQRLPLWEAGKSNVWPVGETLKAPLWPQTDRPIKPYDQSTTWERSKNHSELNKKEDAADKVVLPKITMKTWNSLTSDPATWPYKLPSAKPWPKDENGKSYNPNADLVRKLGLDKENNADWPKDKDDRTGRLVFEKQIDPVSSKDMLKKKEFARLNDSKYKPISNRSNYSDYKRPSQNSVKETPNWMYRDVKQPAKEWIKPQIAANSPKNGDVWERKFDVSAGSQVKSDGSSFSRFWPLNTVAEQKWSDKERDDLTGAWKDNAKDNSPLSTKVNNGNFWKEKSNDFWLPKTKADFWATRMKSGPASRMGDNNSWTSKAEHSASWMLKPHDATSWTTNGDIWGKSGSSDPSSAGSSELPAWSAKEKNLVAENTWVPKSNNVEDWPQKAKDNNSWASKFGGMASWKSNEDNWPRKSEPASWQQKINDDWNIGYGKNSPSTWPSKWKQFVYHKVTAVPISKPGTTADVSSPKSKNAFVAVSAVSSANYGNEWRKNDAEEAMRDDNFRLEEADRPGGQIRPEADRPIYAWKKDGSELNNAGRGKSNGTEPLENQLEALRQDDFWPCKPNKAETSEESTYSTTSTTQPAIVTNFTTMSQPPQQQITSKAVEKRAQTYRRESLMK